MRGRAGGPCLWRRGPGWRGTVPGLGRRAGHTCAGRVGTTGVAPRRGSPSWRRSRPGVLLFPWWCARFGLPGRAGTRRVGRFGGVGSRGAVVVRVPYRTVDLPATGAIQRRRPRFQVAPGLQPEHRERRRHQDRAPAEGDPCRPLGPVGPDNDGPLDGGEPIAQDPQQTPHGPSMHHPSLRCIGLSHVTWDVHISAVAASLMKSCILVTAHVHETTVRCCTDGAEDRVLTSLQSTVPPSTSERVTSVSLRDDRRSLPVAADIEEVRRSPV